MIPFHKDRGEIKRTNAKAFTVFLHPGHKTITRNLYNELDDQRRIVLMKTTKLSYLLFSLAMVAALVLAAIPTSPAHALSAAPVQQSTSIGAADNHSPVLTSGIVVCKTRILWRNGHRIAIRVCHRVHRHDA